jgi:hypothetical protein
MPRSRNKAAPSHSSAQSPRGSVPPSGAFFAKIQRHGGNRAKNDPATPTAEFRVVRRNRARFFRPQREGFGMQTHSMRGSRWHQSARAYPPFRAFRLFRGHHRFPLQQPTKNSEESLERMVFPASTLELSRQRGSEGYESGPFDSKPSADAASRERGCSVPRAKASWWRGES